MLVEATNHRTAQVSLDKLLLEQIHGMAMARFEGSHLMATQ